MSNNSIIKITIYKKKNYDKGITEDSWSYKTEIELILNHPKEIVSLSYPILEKCFIEATEAYLECFGADFHFYSFYCTSKMKMWESNLELIAITEDGRRFVSSSNCAIVPVVHTMKEI